MTKKRGNNEGSITRRPDGRWMAQVTIGRDPETGKPGESPKTVQTMLGHSRVAITLDIYSHVSLELKKKAAAKLNAALTDRG